MKRIEIPSLRRSGVAHAPEAILDDTKEHFDALTEILNDKPAAAGVEVAEVVAEALQLVRGDVAVIP